jgi:hypothetical protein
MEVELMVLESSSERVRLLKVGIPGKKIEQMYITMNKITVHRFKAR